MSSLPLPLAAFFAVEPNGNADDASRQTAQEGVRLANEARAILLDGVAHVLRQYARACRPGTDADDSGVCGE